MPTSELETPRQQKATCEEQAFIPSIETIDFDSLLCQIISSFLHERASPVQLYTQSGYRLLSQV